MYLFIYLIHLYLSIGTLTCNRMVFRKMVIHGECYGQNPSDPVDSINNIVSVPVNLFQNDSKSNEFVSFFRYLYIYLYIYLFIYIYIYLLISIYLICIYSPLFFRHIAEDGIHKRRIQSFFRDISICQGSIYVSNYLCI
jgi:magnesium-transporting ATPase (P-type)